VGMEAFLMDRPWFDQETDVLLIDQYIVEMDSYKRIDEDGSGSFRRRHLGWHLEADRGAV